MCVTRMTSLLTSERLRLGSKEKVAQDPVAGIAEIHRPFAEVLAVGLLQLLRHFLDDLEQHPLHVALRVFQGGVNPAFQVRVIEHEYLSIEELRVASPSQALHLLRRLVRAP